jgi:hypothetical protein
MRLRDGTPIALFRRNAFGYSDNLSLSNFTLPQKFTAKPDDSNCHGTQVRRRQAWALAGVFKLTGSLFNQDL